MSLDFILPASRGAGPEEYRLRYPVYLHETFTVNEQEIARIFLGENSLRIEKASYGFLLEAGGFESEEAAKRFSCGLEIEFRRMCIQQRVAAFFPTEIASYHPRELLFRQDEFPAWEKNHSDGIIIDGVVPSTQGCVVPEHLKIIYVGEILLSNYSIIIPVDKIDGAILSAINRKNDEQSISEMERIALDFFSLACSRQSPAMRVVNLVTALEVLAASAGIRDGYVHGIRKLFSDHDVDVVIKGVELGSSVEDMPLSKALYAVRSNILHRGQYSRVRLDMIIDAGMAAASAILMQMRSMAMHSKPIDE